MKAEFEINLDKNGNPVVRFRHLDKSTALEQQALGVFIKAVKENGVVLRNPNGYIDSEGNSWENYELQIGGKY